MPVRFLSDAQREQLSGFPAELDDEALDRFVTLSVADVAESRQRRGEGNRLGWSLLLCGLRMLRFCPDDVTMASVGAVRFVARQLGVDPGVLTGCGKRAQTRTDQVSQVKAYSGFRSPTAADLGEVRTGWRPRRWFRTARWCPDRTSKYRQRHLTGVSRLQPAGTRSTPVAPKPRASVC